MTTNKGTPGLTIGAILGDSDPESMAWSRAIGELSLRVRELRVGLDTPLSVSVEFHIDGRLAPNEFQGVRTGIYNRKSKRLVVQAAVARSDTIDDKRAVLLALLDESISAAERYAQKRNITPDLAAIRELVKQVAEA